MRLPQTRVNGALYCGYFGGGEALFAAPHGGGTREMPRGQLARPRQDAAAADGPCMLCARRQRWCKGVCCAMGGE